jgi:hypothetical protein
MHIKMALVSYSAPTTNLDAPAKNVQNFKDIHVDQPGKKKKWDTLPLPRFSSVEPLQYETVFRNVFTSKEFCVALQSALCN